MGAICTIHSVVEKTKFVETDVTFIEKKPLLSTRSYFCWTKLTAVDKSKTGLVKNTYFVAKSDCCLQNINFCQTKVTFVGLNTNGVAKRRL